MSGPGREGRLPRAVLAGSLVVLAALGAAALRAARLDADGVDLQISPRVPVGWILVGLLAAALVLVTVAGRRGLPGREVPRVVRERRSLLERLVVVIGTCVLVVLAVRGAWPQSAAEEEPVGEVGTTGATAAVAQSSDRTTVLVLGAVLALAVLAAVAARRARNARPADDDREDADPQPTAGLLAEAATAGSAALRTSREDPRGAVLACYAAMEAVLADRGAARDAAETPMELLSRVATGGLAPRAAATTLTQLFEIARYSSRPMGRDEQAVAQAALDELHAAGAPAPRP